MKPARARATPCPAFDHLLANRVLANRGSTTTWNLPIPDETRRLGSRFFPQCPVLDPTAMSLEMIGTNADDARIGVVKPWRWE